MEVSASSQTSDRANRWYFAAFVCVLLVWNLAGALYAAAGVSFSARLNIVGYLLQAMIVYFWFKSFARDNSLDMPVDMGWLLYLAWWVVVPIYLFKARGFRAFRTILIIVGAYLLTYAVSVLVYYSVV